ncbi:SAM-dependent methyltransferase [Actinacidiphila bryophytorum]|uniref:Cyclopropane-fatty-acyl-phospholipid synthase n=1 Tax=Actinacidiphila bryophytorum TaxID=1436133 RepID=A0A9W4H4J4_9ACTN|nr:cyclopropane-fatty-acyl-phospholipid synthase family protein [Actinacidiphila bryophytorum]MBM9435792.1 class I SAM-dependent methyltransferase [Actinacidiphila bryophytorum]MBN6541635.1 class I SAM-dependent methyltransferase [Actinacidiphila bryophytorum]CAG7650209.1 Cyclopropane-fatty-acyl-phospholipid synthase [Actinacidiphila bryophytorum]
MTTVAQRLGPVLESVFSGEAPLRLRAWDGSETGPAAAPVVVLHSRRALRRLLWQPGELGVAEAYIAGDLDVEGDLAEGLGRVLHAVRERPAGPAARPFPLPRIAGLRPAEAARAAGVALRLGVLGPRPAAPGAPRARLRGKPHSTARDRAAISHHYDLSNDWYAALLDPSMAYSCGYWTAPEDDPAYGLADAQRDKLELICRKLALAPAGRLLDVGCGWGSLALHAAVEHRVHVTAITLSREQHDFVAARVRERGLTELVQVRLGHYRDLDASGGTGYDAVSAVEMGEHVGEPDYPGFASRLHRLLRPRGRLLVQQMSRDSTAPGGGAFIEAYIAPDMHMRPVGATVGMLESAGLEVRSVESLREHYVRTIRAWLRTLEDDWPRFTVLAGEPTARLWRLYLAGAALAFAERRMGVDQILAVRTAEDGGSGMPATPSSWYGERP